MPSRSRALVLMHVVWATKHRAALLSPSMDELIVRILGQKARDVRCSLLAGGCADDHVHVAVRLAPDVPLEDLVRRM